MVSTVDNNRSNKLRIKTKINPVIKTEDFFVRFIYSLIKPLPQNAAIPDGIAKHMQKVSLS